MAQGGDFVATHTKLSNHGILRCGGFRVARVRIGMDVVDVADVQIVCPTATIGIHQATRIQLATELNDGCDLLRFNQ